MSAYEEILQMIEDATREGLLAYSSDPSPFEEEDIPLQGEGADDEENSEATIKKYKRPWWICQPYIRPLPKEALEKGSLQLGKKALKKKREAEMAERDGGIGMVEGTGQMQGQVEGEVDAIGREGRDERDGVPAAEVAKEAMVCG
ncbi:MAG: hypothetical protein Q9218_005044 [Villophora microphyllina]